MGNSALSEEAQKKYLDTNCELLQDQAQKVCCGIFSTIDPDMTFGLEHD